MAPELCRLNWGIWICLQEVKTPQSKVIITASSPWARLIGSEALICDHDGLRLTLGDDIAMAMLALLVAS